MNRHVLLLTLTLGILAYSTANATDWILATSYYSHDPQTGRRVTQYAPTARVFVEVRADYVRSGYRHTESRIQVGGSADRLHMTEEWGRPVRPYGEWQFPYRPYAVPYDFWGPPYGGSVPGFPHRSRGYGFDHFGRGYGPGYEDSPHGHSGHAHDRGEGPGHQNKDKHDAHPDRPDHHPLPGDDGFPGNFRRRPTTDHEFFWPRPRDPARSGIQAEDDGTPTAAG